MLKMELEYDQGILFVRLKGDLNRKTSYKINNYLNPVIKKHRIKCLVYNCNNLNYIDATGIDAIINSKYLIKNNKGKIWVCAISGGIKQIFKYMRIPSIVNESVVYNLVGDK